MTGLFILIPNKWLFNQILSKEDSHITFGTFCLKVTVQRKTFEGENFREFHIFVAIRESFLREIWGVASFGAAKAIRKSFLCKNRIFTNLQKFSPSKVSRYTVCSHCHVPKLLPSAKKEYHKYTQPQRTS